MLNNPHDFVKYLFHKGELKDAYKYLGSHLVFDNAYNIIGVSFYVYAPHAKSVSVIGDFNNWDYRNNPMDKVSFDGLFYAFIPNVTENTKYQYEIILDNNQHLQIPDPFSFYNDVNNEISIVYHIDGYKWHDQEYQALLKTRNYKLEPLIIYELHLTSWKKKSNGGFFSYKELINELIPYVLTQGFTHLEIILPYENKPISTFGEPKDLMSFIDCCHKEGLGVIWEYNLSPYNLDENETRSQLLARALFWLDYYHVDGFKINVLDTSKEFNFSTIDFLRLFNSTIREHKKETLLIACDKFDLPNITKSVNDGGLGYNFMWNHYWKNDVLEYFEEESLFRKYLHKNITYSILDAYKESFILPISFDELYNKKSLINRMPGDYWQKFANYRLLIGFFITFPGKKLFYMGCEFAHMREYKPNEALDWRLLEYPSHDAINHFMKDIFHLYKIEKALHETDNINEGFTWIEANNNQSIYIYYRNNINNDEFLVIVLNATPIIYHDYQIGVPKDGFYEEIFNSDRQYYGGYNQYNMKLLKTNPTPSHGYEQHISITIPPLGFSIFKLIKS
ncbi:MAG TPA: alpha amylase C-terminal domain-containing protein [Haloplasmataceae bacterium]